MIFNNVIMNLNHEQITNFPVPEKILHKTKFGAVDNTRGENTMNPVVELDDYYHWMRSDDRKDEKVLEHLKLENSYTEFMMKDMEETKENLTKNYYLISRRHTILILLLIVIMVGNQNITILLEQ